MSETSRMPELATLPPEPGLNRSLTLMAVVLYGLGVTIGAGIYVLIGATAARAGLYAPTAFLISAFVMAFSAASYAAMAVRYPVSGGEAVFVDQGFGRPVLGLIVGLLIMTSGLVSAATISLGAAGYIGQFVPMSPKVLAGIVVIGMGIVAALSVNLSVGIAGALTVVEVGGLLIVITAGFGGEPETITRLPELVPHSLDGAVWGGIFAAGLLAFFAFIGFEDMVNIAEEVERPERNLPLAIFVTLGLATLIYFLVAAVAVLRVGPAALEGEAAPLALIFSRVTPFPIWVMTVIAIIATLNGVIIQIIMAARVAFGLASRGRLPRLLAKVHPRTRTPVTATVIMTALVLGLAVSFDLTGLAEMTSRVTLLVFVLVNLALVRIKLKGIGSENREGEAAGGFDVPIWVPAIGAVLSIFLMIGGT
ncbi:APC family permease [Cucumibacter marinus]|uniref:APC family permease n=1 Tax=Cucumibacter marinus TaxID=1121252 RepID=UPI000685A1BF|nr:amino acid permease [Cucumibacter marinus]